MNILNFINSPNDIKSLSNEQLQLLASDIRDFLIESISKTGGHLSSNLGVVELTIALHFCFDFSIDKIVWDVGHQSYIHKILTGRKHLFPYLRTFDGLSGFPKTSESIFDHFDTGHSSTSISAATGFATARDLLNKDFHVVSVVGDGAMTGGLVFEAMNNICNKKNFLIILNDNQMSISENVGNLSNYLTNLRTAPKYLNAKLNVHHFFDKYDFGYKVNDFLHKSKNLLKYALLPNVMFENLGIKYIGPIDGHNIDTLISSINKTKNIQSPVLLHIITKKGKGYEMAEQFPYNFHSVSSFNRLTGEFFNKKSSETFSDIFGKFMVKEANRNNKLVAITASMPDGTGLSSFKNIYPNRFFDVGIAEAHATIFAASLAKQGFVPVFAVYSTFLQRAYDQIIHDVCIQNLHVVFAIDRGGIVGEDGETHQGIFDLSYLSHIPNLTILSPKDKIEFIDMLDYSINYHSGPIAIRYPKGVPSNLFEHHHLPISYNKSQYIFSGEKIIILAVGHMMHTAKIVYDKLKDINLNPTLVNVRFISPIDSSLVDDINNYDFIFTIEDNVLNGGFGSSLSTLLISNQIFNKKIFNFSFPNKFIEQGSISTLYQKYYLDADSIFNKIVNILNL